MSILTQTQLTYFLHADHKKVCASNYKH